jgi:signal transduction histidine kinase
MTASGPLLPALTEPSGGISPDTANGAAAPSRNRLWLVLLGGFSLLLLLMAAAGAQALAVLGHMNSADALLLQRFQERSRLLSQIRAQIYLSGTLVRDSILAPAPVSVKAQMDRLAASERDATQALSQYGRETDAEERAAFLQLQAEVTDYWAVLHRTLSSPRLESQQEKYAFFYDQLVPRRTAMLQIADRVEALDEAALSRGEAAFTRQFDRFRLASLTTLIVALFAGLVVTVLTTIYVLRLSRESEHRLQETVSARAALQELSARLVRAQEDERRALSRELHDEVSQAFSAILMETDNLLDTQQLPEERARLTAVRGLATRGVDVTRNMSLLLRPSMLDDFGLIPALRWLARDAGRRTGLRVQVDAPEAADDLPEEHKTCIFRIVQEALRNVARHAQARSVQITVRSEADHVSVSIQDDGAGFDTRWVRGLGLLGMAERVRHVGGRFSVDSHPGRGTTLSAELPLAEILSGENGNGHNPDSARR